MQAFIVLCDAAQHDGSSGKINILGGDWSATDTKLPQSALAVFVRASWEEAATRRVFALRLLDDDGRPVTAGTPGKERPVEYTGAMELSGAAATVDDAVRSVDIHNSFAVTVPRLPLLPGRRYTWSLEVDGQVLTSVAFAVTSDAGADPES
ncbi:DUF6941 family protein [Planomonospora algeriensis]